MAEETKMPEQDRNALACVVYVSSARTKMTDAELADLLEHARQNNTNHGISGILAYWDGNFIQYVEGPAGELGQLMINLERDPRHNGIIVLQKEPIAARAFPDWSMAFDRAGSSQDSSAFLSDGFLTADPDRFSPFARLQLDMFRKHIR